MRSLICYQSSRLNGYRNIVEVWWDISIPYMGLSAQGETKQEAAKKLKDILATTESPLNDEDTKLLDVWAETDPAYDYKAAAALMVAQWKLTGLSSWLFSSLAEAEPIEADRWRMTMGHSVTYKLFGKNAEIIYNDLMHRFETAGLQLVQFDERPDGLGAVHAHLKLIGPGSDIDFGRDLDIGNLEARILQLLKRKFPDITRQAGADIPLVQVWKDEGEKVNKWCAFETNTGLTGYGRTEKLALQSLLEEARADGITLSDPVKQEVNRLLQEAEK